MSHVPIQDKVMFTAGTTQFPGRCCTCQCAPRLLPALSHYTQGKTPIIEGHTEWQVGSSDEIMGPLGGA